MDVYCYRIPNSLIVFGLSSGCLLQFQQNSYFGILQGIAGIVLPILILYPLFIMRGLGAGDIKLFSVVGCYLPIKISLMTLCTAFLIGALLSLIKMIIHKNLFFRMQYLATYLKKSISSNQSHSYHSGIPDKNSVIPFSIPILLSVLLHWGGIY